jgi:hypothetical protein
MTTSNEWRTEKLLNRLQNGSHREKEARQTNQHMEGWNQGEYEKKRAKG